jgi:hypothetical protein
MLYDEPDEPEPEPPRRLDTAPRSQPDWAPWEAWVTARIDSALAAEREWMAEVVSLALGETLAKALGAEREPWEAWVTARIDSALAEEREWMAEVVSLALGETLAKALGAEREASAQALRDLRADLNRAEAVVERLHRVIELERSRVVDLPALPLRRDLN